MNTFHYQKVKLVNTIDEEYVKYHYNDPISFELVSNVNKNLFYIFNNPSYRVVIMSSCRETLLRKFSDYKEHVNNIDNLCILISLFSTSPDIWIEYSLSIIHAIEDYLGWERTKVYIVDEFKKSGKYFKTHYFAYVFDCDKKWFNATQLISLYLLIIRVFYNENFYDYDIKHFKEILTHPDAAKGIFIDEYEDEINIANAEGNDISYDVDCISYFIDFMPYIHTVLDNIDLLFFYDDTVVNFSSCSNYGINNLIKGIAQPKIKETWKWLNK